LSDVLRPKKNVVFSSQKRTNTGFSTGFPDVDAAIIRNDTLYALQYSVRGNHDLNETSIQSFVTKVLKNNAFEGVQYVKILYVVPLGSTGLTVTLEEEFNLTKASGKETRTNKWKEGQATPSTLPPNYSVDVFRAEPDEFTAIDMPTFPFLGWNTTELVARLQKGCDFESMTVTELKNERSCRGLSVYGTKAE
jgi:hypothetical protein